MTKRKLYSLNGVLIACLAMGLAPNTASAQTAETSGETVLVRPQPEFEPLGVRAGPFLIFPKYEQLEEYNTNVYATESNERADLINHMKPSFRVSSQWQNHALNFRGSSDIGRYTDETREDFEDYRIGTDGRIDIQRDTNIVARAGYAHLHDARGDANDVAGNSPTLRDEYTGALGASHEFNRVSLDWTGDLTRKDYHDVATSAGGVSTGQINNDDRDRNEWRTSLRAGYELFPSYEGFAKFEWVDLAYLSSRDDGGYNRNNNGYRATAGVKLALTNLLTGDLYAGYLQRFFNDTSLPSEVAGPVLGVALTWNVTQLTTVRLRGNREVLATTQAGVAGIDEWTSELKVDHELLRNLIIQSKLGMTYDQFRRAGPVTERKDMTYNGGTGVEYRLNRNFFAGVRYDFTHRASQGSINGDYTAHKVFLKLGAQL